MKGFLSLEVQGIKNLPFSALQIHRKNSFVTSCRSQTVEMRL